MIEGRFPILIQPVYDKHLNWNGFNLVLCEDESVPASVLPQLAEEWEDFKSLPNFRFFISLNPDWLRSGMPELPFSADQITFVLTRLQAQDSDLLMQCKALKPQGFRFAVYGEANSIPSQDEVASIAIFDAKTAQEKGQAGISPLGENSKNIPDPGWCKAAQSETKLFAAGIDNAKLFEWCVEKEFAFYTFASLSGFRDEKNKLQGSSRVTLMRLLTLVSQDADTRELERTIRTEPRISFDLLRLVNSASMGLRTKISTFSHALSILGRRQLQRWVQLLLFAHQKQENSGPSILMQRAATRGRLMELLTRAATPSPTIEFQEQAFMVGVFSLLDILMDDPLDNILKTLHLADNIEAALLRREGNLGEMLKLVEHAENFDFGEAAVSLGKLNVSPEFFCQAQATALSWTHRLNAAG